MRVCLWAAESAASAHTASTSCRVCMERVRRCSIADLETPATCQQGSRRVVPGVPRGLAPVDPGELPGIRTGGVPDTFPQVGLLELDGGVVVGVCARTVEMASAASNRGRAYLIQDMRFLLRNK